MIPYKFTLLDATGRPRPTSGVFSSPNDLTAAERVMKLVAEVNVQYQGHRVELVNLTTGSRQILAYTPTAFQFGIVRESDGEWIVSGDIDAPNIAEAFYRVGTYFSLHEYSCYDYRYFVVDPKENQIRSSYIPRNVH